MNNLATKEDIAEIKESIKILTEAVNDIKDNFFNYKEKVAENYINQKDCDTCSNKKDENISDIRKWIVGTSSTMVMAFIGLIYWVSDKFQDISFAISSLVK